MDLSASATIEYYQMQEYRKWAVYPTLQLNYMPSASHILQLSFSSDKTYPDYWTLSGATSYLNGYNESLGNPFLRPYTDYNVDLTYILKSKYIFQASYSYTPDYFMQTVYLDSDRLKAIYNWQNWDYAQDAFFHGHSPFQGRKLVGQPSHPTGYLETRQGQCILRCTFQSEAMGRRRTLDTYLPAMPPA